MSNKSLNETGKYILEIIKRTNRITLSWGISSVEAIMYENMKSLKFRVNGFIHNGKVIISVNEGADVFEVFLFSGAEIKRHEENVYLDQLINVIDGLVETKDEKSSEYKNKIDGFLINKFLTNKFINPN